MWEPDAILLQTILLNLRPLLILFNLKTCANTYVGIGFGSCEGRSRQTLGLYYLCIHYFSEVFFCLHLWSGYRHYMYIRGIGICIIWPLTLAVMTRLNLDVWLVIDAMEVDFCLERLVSLNG